MGGTQTHPTDLEVFLEAVGLEEVGEFEGADVAALSADLALKIGDDGAQVLERVAQPERHADAPGGSCISARSPGRNGLHS